MPQPGYPQPGYPPVGYQQPGYQSAPVYGQQPMTWAQIKPGILPIRPLAFSELLSGPFNLLRFNPKATLGLSAVVVLIVCLVVMIPQTIFTSLFASSSLPSALSDNEDFSLVFGSATGTVVSNFGATLMSLISTVVLIAPLTLVTLAAMKGRVLSGREAMRESKSKIVRIIGLSLLLALISAVATAIAVAIIVGVIFALMDRIGLAIGISFLIGVFVAVGMLALIVRLWLAQAVCVIEDIGVFDSLRRAWVLSKGAWWRIFGAVVIMSFLVGVISSIPGAIISVLSLVIASTASSVITAAVVTRIVTMLLTALTVIFQLPLITSVVSLLYIDQRIRTEGYDLELLAEISSGNNGGGTDVTVSPEYHR